LHSTAWDLTVPAPEPSRSKPSRLVTGSKKSSWEGVCPAPEKTPGPSGGKKEVGGATSPPLIQPDP